ncbi:MAG TPA: YbaK/EbsC family protein [Desulfuromonadales bacterium]|nr:YbaK/EbsC family protein [Desulfuromonadales bacterium]
MSIDRAREYLKKWHKDREIQEFEVSSATVALAARALNTDEARIAKSLSFKIDNRGVLIVVAGDMKIDNRKFKDEFNCKAVMLSPGEVEELIGHAIGGVCPFGINEDVDVYLDISLKRFDTVYPACGSPNSAIELSCEELEEIARPGKWVDVCKA